MKKTVVVAMSGGVDSSVAAVLMQQKGYDVIGITMKLTNGSGCCGIKDIQDAKQVAQDFNFEHHVLDYSEEFKTSVIDYFIDSYANGETPLPCVKCNQHIKFSALLKATKQLGAEKLITGHYARIINNSIYTSHDSIKDQTYFIFTTKKEDIPYLDFPIGNFDNKAEIRKIAKSYNIRTFDKSESQDICFVKSKSYKTFLEKHIKCPDGNIIDLNGNVLGTHNGIDKYTVGQKSRIGGLEQPHYVYRINAADNTITVCVKDECVVNHIHIKDTNWIENIHDIIDSDAQLNFKFRARQAPIKGEVINIDDTNASIKIESKQYIGIAPGQACVAYKDNCLVGGGWIQETENKCI